MPLDSSTLAGAIANAVAMRLGTQWESVRGVVEPELLAMAEHVEFIQSEHAAGHLSSQEAAALFDSSKAAIQANVAASEGFGGLNFEGAVQEVLGTISIDCLLMANPGGGEVPPGGNPGNGR